MFQVSEEDDEVFVVGGTDSCGFLSGESGAYQESRRAASRSLFSNFLVVLQHEVGSDRWKLPEDDDSGCAEQAANNRLCRTSRTGVAHATYHTLHESCI